ncbi:MAG: tetratricopeptide repeat protein [Vicinamibacterales bacterium]
MVFAALAVKLIILFQLADHPLLGEQSGLDTTAYAELARRVVAGDLGLGPGVYYLSPLYIYFLATWLAIGDSLTLARVVQVILGALAVGAIWQITDWWRGRRAAWIASGVAIATGVVTFYEVVILQAALDTALTAAVLLALAAALRSGQPTLYGLAGCALGLAALNRPNFLLVIAGLTVLLLIVKRARPAVLIVAGAALACAPVAIRNGVVAGEWLSVSSHGGLNLYIGNSPQATGFYVPVPGVTPSIAGQARDTREVAGRALGREVTDAEASDYFRDQALTWMREHPLDAGALFVKKFLYTFHAKYVALPHSYPFYVHDTDAWLRFLPFGPWIVIPLGLVGLGLLVMQQRNTTTALWVSFVPMYAAAVAVFFVADRYRLPLLVPLCVGTGITLDALVIAVREQRWRSAAVPVAAGVVLLVAVNLPSPLNEGRWAEGLKLAQRYAILNDDAAARAWVDRLAPDATPPGTAHHMVGRQYLADGKPDRAIGYLRDAVAMGLGHPQVLGDLATAAQQIGESREALNTLRTIEPSSRETAEFWLKMGRLGALLQSPVDAEPFFRHAVTMTPDNADARLQFGVNLVVQQKIPEGREQLAAAVAQDPRMVDALAYLAYCEATLGDVDAARRHADAALAIDPAHPIARQVRQAISGPAGP